MRWNSASVCGLCWPLRAGCPVFANPFSVTSHERPRAGTLPPQLPSPAPWPVTSLGTNVSLLLTLTSNLVSTGSPAGRQLVVSLRGHRGSRRSVYQLFPAPGHSRGGWTTGPVTFTVWLDPLSLKDLHQLPGPSLLPSQPEWRRGLYRHHGTLTQTASACWRPGIVSMPRVEGPESRDKKGRAQSLRSHHWLSEGSR